jgi:hypothetical protein
MSRSLTPPPTVSSPGFIAAIVGDIERPGVEPEGRGR